MFHDHVGSGTDVWALAGLMHAILSGGFFLFHSYYGVQKEVLREVILILGKLPEKWWNRWSERSEYFDKSDKFMGKRSLTSGNLLKIWLDRMSSDELSEFRSIILKMVTYEIADRISAAEVELLIAESWKVSHIPELAGATAA